MTYKIDEKNLKQSFILANLLLLVAFFFAIVVSSVIVPSKIKEQVYTEKVVAKSANMYPDDDSYYIKFIYEVDGKEYTHNAFGANHDDKYDDILYCKKDDPYFCISTYEIKKANEYMILLWGPVIIFVASCIVRITNLVTVSKVKRLCKKGVLVKNIPYKLVPANLEVDGKTIMAFCITYTFPDGTTKELISKGIYKDVNETGLCDLLYDPIDFNNYYIDTNIKITGKGSPVIIHYQ